MEGKLTEVPFGAYGELEKMCKTLWHEAYDGLIGPSQVGYMLENSRAKAPFTGRSARKITAISLSRRRESGRDTAR